MARETEFRPKSCVYSAVHGRELVMDVSRCCAQKPNCGNLYEMAAKYDWEANDVLAFLRCQKTPSKRMLRDIAKELDETVASLEHILNR